MATVLEERTADSKASEEDSVAAELIARANNTKCGFKYKVLMEKADALQKGIEYKPYSECGGLSKCADDRYCSNGDRKGCSGFIRRE